MFKYISQRREIIRAYYAGLGKTGLTSVASFLVAVAFGQVALGLVFYVREVFGATAGQIGALAATWAICYAVGCLFIRPAFSRFLPRYLIIGATFCAFVFTLTMRFAPSLAWIFILQGLNGFCLSLFWPPLMGWLSSDLEVKALSKAVSRFNLSWCLGNIISPFIAGWLSQIAVHLPLYAGSGIYIVAAVFVAGAAFALPSTPAEGNTRNNAGRADAGRSTLLRYPAWVGLFAAYFAIGVVLNIFPLMGRYVLGFSKRTVGTVLLVRGLFNAATFMFLGRTAFWHFRSLPMLLGQLLGVAAFVGLIFTTSPYAIAALLGLFGFSIALSYSESIFHGASGSGSRAARMAIHESILAAGMVAGPAIGGRIYQAYPDTRVYWLCAAILLTSAVVQAALCLWARKRERAD